jgi:integrase
MGKKLTERKKLTDRFCATAKRPGITWDAGCTGLGFKVTPSKKKLWVMQLRWPGHGVQTVRNIGIYGAAPLAQQAPIHARPLTLAEAQDKARQFYALAKAGSDPFELEDEQKRQAEAAKRAEAARRENTFAALCERHIAERHAAARNRRADADAREIRRMLVTAWGTKPVHEIAPDDVRALIQTLLPGSPYNAKAAWGHAVLIFKLAVEEKLIAASPCASLDSRRLFKNAKIGPRQRTLNDDNDDELLAFWRATGRMGYPAQQVYRLLVLTGCRLNEIVHAKWSELRPELRRILREAARKNERVNWAAVPDAHKVLTIPPERFKSGRVHHVQLSDAACAVLESLPRFGKSDDLFTATGKKGPIWFGAKWKSRVDARMLRTLKALARRRGDNPADVKLKPWVNHDLRRVVRSNLSGLHNHDDGPEIPDHVSELVLGHGRQGLQGIYDQNKYAKDIRAALERWAARLHDLTHPAGTTPPLPAPVAHLAERRRGAG